ncbi:YncE family protein [Candidatus Electronema sp. JM]|uniref:YncE family protein n=1 Tax=Candidatus Electronema sp. JM TaxID=3401571 RepID=UPI003AA93C36
MRKALALCSFLLLSAQLGNAAPGSGPRFLDTWSEMNSWESGASPAALAQTMDKKLVFVLGSDGNVQVYSAVGEQLGTVAVPGQATAIDIDPRGKTLYAIDRSGFCTVFSVSLETGAAAGTVRSHWQTQARPVDIACLPDRGLVFILEADSIVRVYSTAGELRNYLPVPKGISGLDLVPRSNMLYLVNRNGYYAALRLGGL